MKRRSNRCGSSSITSRVGYDTRNPWLTAEADVSFSRAKFTDDDAAGNNIPGALDRVVSGAVPVEPVKRLFGSIRTRHFSPVCVGKTRSPPGV